MFTKPILFFGLIAAAIAEPLPQGAAATTSIGDAIPTSFDTAGLASSESALEASLSAEQSVYSSLFSGLPTLPLAIESVLATAIPADLATQANIACQITAEPDWYKSLPASVQSALSSYESAAESWYKDHSAAISSFEASLTSGISFSSYTGGYTAPAIPVCTGAGGAVVGASSVAGSSSAKTTPTTAASKTGSGSGSGSSSSSTASGTAASAKSSGGAAPTGAVSIGAAGVVGLLGLLVAL